jgi:putative peptidoglycan lipid II flippase
VWIVLAGSTVGLLASTQARLCASAFWALGDTRTPLAFALIRVVITGVLGWAAALPIPRALGWPPEYGAAGLTASAGLAGWIEFLLLYRGLSHRIGRFSLGGGTTARAWLAALASGGVAFALHRAVPIGQPILAGVVVLGLYGVLYLSGALLLGVAEVKNALARLRR